MSAGALRSTAPDAVRFPHRWTAQGVAVQAPFTGAHLLHLAAAGCVLNDVYREAERLGLSVAGVRVMASGEFDTTSWKSAGIVYAVEVDGPAVDDVELLLAAVDEVAEIPKSIRAGAMVRRVSPRPDPASAAPSDGLAPAVAPPAELG